MRTNAVAARRQTGTPILLLCSVFILWGGASVGAGEGSTLSDQLVGREFAYVVQPGDSLTAIGARFGVSASVLASRNGLAPNARLTMAQELAVDNRHIVPRSLDDGFVINLPQRMLFLITGGQAH